MSRALRSALLTALVLVGCLVLLAVQHQTPIETATADVLAADDNLHWYKGNIHTHSLWSDGDDYLEMIALWYRERGYDFLCFTDHNVLSNVERWIDVEESAGGREAYDKLKARFPTDWVDERTVDRRLQVRLKTFDEVNAEIGQPGEYLLIMGEEITDRFKNLPVHLNASNIQELIPPLGGNSVYETMQNNVNAVIAQRERTGEPILVHMNHPNFHYGITAEELMRVRGENFFEVYNGHPGVRNSGDEQHASTDRMWDIMLTRRIAELKMPVMYGLGTDDGHDYHDIPSRASEPGRGWIVVLAEKLTPHSLIMAIENGRFYASSGVELDRVVSSPRGLEVEMQTEPDVDYTIEFIGTRKDYDSASRPVVDDDGNEVRATRIYSDDIGEVLKKVDGAKGSYQFDGDELYVRARVTSTKKHPNPSEPGENERAWVQPAIGPAAPETE